MKFTVGKSVVLTLMIGIGVGTLVVDFSVVADVVDGVDLVAVEKN